MTVVGSNISGSKMKNLRTEKKWVVLHIGSDLIRTGDLLLNR